MKPIYLFAAILTACCATIAAAAGSADSVAVVDPYVRQAPPGAQASAAFMVLRNLTDKDARVIKADTSASKITQLHTHLNENGVMKMRQVAFVDVKAHGETALQPGGLHVMMIDLKGPLKEGDKVAITLGFEDGSSKTIEAPVRAPVPAPAAPMDHAAHQH
jgi:copper(I)-binding protein